MRDAEARIREILERGGDVSSTAGAIARLFDPHPAGDPLEKVGAAFPSGLHLYRLEESGKLIFETANRAADEILGVDHQRFSGLTIEEAFPALVETDIPQAYRNIAAQGGVFSRDVFRYSGGEVAGVFAFTAFQLAPGRVATVFHDATRERRALRLAELQRDLGFRLGASSGLDESLGLFLDSALAATGLDAGAVFLCEPESSAPRLVRASGLGPGAAAALGKVARPGLAAAGDGQVVMRSIAGLPSPVQDALAAEGITFTAVVPVCDTGQALASLVLASRLKSEIPGPALEAVEAVAGRMGAVIAGAQDRQALVESEKRFRDLFDTVPVGLAVTLLDGTLVALNQTLRRELGSLPEPLADIRSLHAHPGQREFILEKLKDPGGIRDLEVDFCFPDGPLRPFSLSASLSTYRGQPAILSALVDISSRKKAEADRARLEEQLRQACNMEAIGRLAGGIAHDFNNVLQAILGFTGLVSELLDPAHQVQEYLSEIEKAAARGNGMVQQLLEVGRRKTPPLHPLQLAEVIEEARASLAAVLPREVELRLRIAGSFPPIHGDRNDCHRVLMNLAANAAHALRSGPGVLEIGLEPVEISDNDPRTRVGLFPGPHLRWWVRDSGEGMDQATMSRLFEPFFTTKETEGGTGLGLASVHGIVQKHRGLIAVESAPGKGTLVEMFFPAATVTALE